MNPTALSCRSALFLANAMVATLEVVSYGFSHGGVNDCVLTVNSVNCSMYFTLSRFPWTRLTN